MMNTNYKSLENQFIYPSPKGSKLIFFAPHGVGVNEENQLGLILDSDNHNYFYTLVFVQSINI